MAYQSDEEDNCAGLFCLTERIADIYDEEGEYLYTRWHGKLCPDGPTREYDDDDPDDNDGPGSADLTYSKPSTMMTIYPNRVEKVLGETTTFSFALQNGTIQAARFVLYSLTNEEIAVDEQPVLIGPDVAEAEFDLSSVASGLYLMVVEVNGTAFQSKVIVTK